MLFIKKTKKIEENNYTLEKEVLQKFIGNIIDIDNEVRR